MRGHITQRSKKKGTWSIVIELDKDATGKRRQKWFTVQGSKKAAEKRLSELLHQLDTGSYIQPGKVTLSEYLDRWLVDYAKANLSPRTVEGYEKIVKGCLKPTLGSILLTSLKPEHLQNFYSQEVQRGLSPQTVRHHHTLIHKALQDAFEWGLLIRNAADAVRPPRTKQMEMQTWNETEMVTFLEAAKDTPYYEIFYLALFTGMRRSELLALRWQDIDLILGNISVTRGVHVLKGSKVHYTSPKTAKSRRTIALTPSTVLMLNEYRDKKETEALLLDKPLQDTDLLFGGLDNKPILPDTLSHAWLKLVKQTGIKAIRLHDARHTHASIMLKQGIHPKIVQERLGHASIQITLDTYSHVAPGLQQTAAIRFDDIIKISHNVEAENNSVSKPLAKAKEG